MDKPSKIMETTLEETTSTLSASTLAKAETFAAFQANSNAPQWFKDLRAKAFDRYNELARPSRKEEVWRYSTQISSFRPETTELLTNEQQTPSKQSPLISNTAGNFFFENNQLQNTKANETEGISFLPLSTAIFEKEELVRPYLEKEFADIGSQKITALHMAYLQDGTFIHVSKNTVGALPYLTQYLQSDASILCNAFTLIIAEENSSVDFIDMFSSQCDQASGYWIARQALYAKAGAKIFHKTIQNVNEKSFVNIASVAEANKDAVIKQISVNLGSQKARSENRVRIQESGADINLYSLTVAHQEQEFDQRTLQEHIGPHATSDLLYKNVLLDNSRTIFSGLIDVKKDAQQTDAYQTNRNLLISKDAEAIAMPGLEIEANDVRCSHGATTGQIDESELFYFLARGIPLAKARELLVFGFFEEIIEKINSEELQEALRKLVQGKFQKISK